MQRLVPGLVQRAAEIFGGMRGLADYLRVPEHALHLWAAAKARAPVPIVERLVDLVLQDDVARAREDRRHEPRGPAGSLHRSKDAAHAQ